MRMPDHLPPIAIRLKGLAQRLGLSQRVLAERTGLSLGALNTWLCTGALPARADAAAVRDGALHALSTYGATPYQMRTAFAYALPRMARPKQARDSPETTEHAALATPKVVEATSAPTLAASCPQPDEETKKVSDEMLSGKQQLTMAARKAFGLAVNPFDGEVTCDEEMFANGEFAYCREVMYQTATHGGFAAVVGESGSGKTTLLGDLEDRLLSESKAIKLIKPSVISSEDNAKRGQAVRSAVIMTAIAMELGAKQQLHGDFEQRSRAVRALMEGSCQAGFQHCLVIEEAHSLHVATLKQLKRLHEYLRTGRRPMLGILLIGQPELKAKLDPSRYDVREVAQRCEVVELQALDGDLRAYLEVRVARAGKSLDSLMTADAVDAIRARLTRRDVQRSAGKQQFVHTSLVYPLAVNNLVTACLNRAASIEARVLDAEIVALV